MRVVVVGAGAIGGFLAARLARAEEDVVVVARGARLAALREHGISVEEASGSYAVPVACTDDIGVTSTADAVLLTMKATSVAEVAPELGRAVRPGTAVVTAQNGIPWWYFDRHGGPLDGTRLRTVDPGGAIARSLDARDVVGCVVYPAAESTALHAVKHVEGIRFPLGELDGARSERCAALSAALMRAGLKAPVRPRIREDIWLKLLGNVAFNPVSTLTRATMDEMAADAEVRGLVRLLMGEAARVAEALGIRFEIPIEQRAAGAERIVGHRTSMLQDLEAGRPLELDPLVGAVVEIADLVGVPVPALRGVYGAVRVLERSARAAAPVAVPA